MLNRDTLADAGKDYSGISPRTGNGKERKAKDAKGNWRFFG
jgi:hypothetical protein